jgi:hypothetical protein
MWVVEVACSSAPDDWPTSPADFDRLNREFGPLELDVCADPVNAKCRCTPPLLTMDWRSRGRADAG